MYFPMENMNGKSIEKRVLIKFKIKQIISLLWYTALTRFAVLFRFYFLRKYMIILCLVKHLGRRLWKNFNDDNAVVMK